MEKVSWKLSFEVGKIKEYFTKMEVVSPKYVFGSKGSFNASEIKVCWQVSQLCQLVQRMLYMGQTNGYGQVFFMPICGCWIPIDLAWIQTLYPIDINLSVSSLCIWAICATAETVNSLRPSLVPGTVVLYSMSRSPRCDCCPSGG